MKRIFACCVFALLSSAAFAADQEFDRQIIMNVPPTKSEHVVRKMDLDDAELGITDVEAPLYWKDPLAGGSYPARYITNIQLMPGIADGTVAYSVDGAAPVDVPVSGLGAAAFVGVEELETLAAEIRALSLRMDQMEAAIQNMGIASEEERKE